MSTYPTELAERGPTDEPEERLTPDKLDITSIVFITDTNDHVQELSAVTSLGNVLVHELCKRRHFDECVEHLTVHKHKWPNTLGRQIELINSKDTPGVGFVSAYDPHDSTRAYQVEFKDITQSDWLERQTFKVKHLPRLMPLMNTDTSTRPLRVLEVCCGGMSFTNQLLKSHPTAHVVTVDIDPKCGATHTVDVRLWRILVSYPPNFFDIIWTSPPCTDYSPALHTTPRDRDLTLADSVVIATFGIIAQAQPRVWFVENPHTMLYQRPFMAPLEQFRNPCTYCKYGRKHKKATDIWTNVELKLQSCSRMSPCKNTRFASGHPATAQRGPSGQDRVTGVPAEEAAQIPSKLLHILISAAQNHLKRTPPSQANSGGMPC